MRYNPPPNWPVPSGWTPEPGWTPDPSWPPAPPGWQFWIDDSAAVRRSHTTRNVLIGVGVGVVVIIAVVVILVAAGAFTSKPHTKSAEEQIRAVVANLEDGWNNTDFGPFVSQFCAKRRSQITEEEFTQKRNKNGTVTFEVDSVTVDGDTAIVDVTETYSKRSTPEDESLDFIKEDGDWKYC